MDEKGKVLQTLTDCTLCTDLSCDNFMVTVYDWAVCWVAVASTLWLRFTISISAANRLIGEVVQSQRRPLLGPSPG